MLKSRWLAVLALATALAVAPASAAVAKPKSPQERKRAFETCVQGGGSVRTCCAEFGGNYTKTTKEWTDSNGYRHVKETETCTFPNGDLYSYESSPSGPRYGGERQANSYQMSRSS